MAFSVRHSRFEKGPRAEDGPETDATSHNPFMRLMKATATGEALQSGIDVFQELIDADTEPNPEVITALAIDLGVGEPQLTEVISRVRGEAISIDDSVFRLDQLLEFFTHDTVCEMLPK